MNSLAVSRLRVVKFALLGGWEGGREGLRSPPPTISAINHKYTPRKINTQDIGIGRRMLIL